MGGIQGLRVERGLGCYTFCSQKSWVVISPRSGHWIQIEAVETIKLAAKQHGLDISGGIIRRTSSRFCLGVEHGDYNGTELFGVGTDRFIWMGYKPNDSGKIRIFSQNFPEKVVEFRPQEVPAPKSSSISDTWARFPYGVEYVLRSNGFDTSRGFDAVMLGSETRDAMDAPLP